MIPFHYLMLCLAMNHAVRSFCAFYPVYLSPRKKKEDVEGELWKEKQENPHSETSKRSFELFGNETSFTETDTTASAIVVVISNIVVTCLTGSNPTAAKLTVYYT